LSGRAEAALESVVLDEGRLQGMEIPVLGEAFDSRDVLALDRCSQGEARQDAPARHEHCTGATLAMVAAFLGPRMIEAFAEKVQKRRACLELGARRPTIEREGNGQ
jgi:hypothetical protein